MSSCPSRVSVAGRPWTIEFIGEEEMHNLSPTDVPAPCGLTFGQSLSMFIGDWTHEHLQRENVLHEIMHACFFGGNFAGKLSAGLDIEEWMLSGMDSPLLTTLRDNPILVAYLCSPNKEGQ